MSAYAIGELTGYLISQQGYLKKRLGIKATILSAIVIEIVATVIFCV